MPPEPGKGADSPENHNKISLDLAIRAKGEQLHILKKNLIGKLLTELILKEELWAEMPLSMAIAYLK